MKRNAIRFVCCLAMLSPVGTYSASTSQTMYEIFDAVAYLLPVSVQRLSDPDAGDDDIIAAKLDVLVQSGDALRQHASNWEAEFQLLARALEQRLDDVRTAFESDSRFYGHFALQGLVENCAGCHSRLPDSIDFVFGQTLIARLDTEAMIPRELARILVATRQFDAALSQYERILADPEADPEEHDFSGLMLEYLNVAIAVQGDMSRPVSTFSAYLQRPDLPYFLSRRIVRWIQTMRELEPLLTENPKFAVAEELFETASSKALVPGDHLTAVEDLVATSILRRLLTEDVEPDLAARCYYMLGVMVLRTLELRPSVPEAELLLVASIRTDPDGPYARDAFALLEEFGFIEDRRLNSDQEGAPLIDLAALRAMIAI